MKTRCIRDDARSRWKERIGRDLRGKPVGKRPILSDVGFGVENDGRA
jgi:hypothetical protein